MGMSMMTMWDIVQRGPRDPILQADTLKMLNPFQSHTSLHGTLIMHPPIKM